MSGVAPDATIPNHPQLNSVEYSPDAYLNLIDQDVRAMSDALLKVRFSYQLIY